MSFWESLGDVFIWFLWASIFVAYLMALFSVFADIVRDGGLKGWAKAIWIILLIFFPFITAFVYLVARGDGMSERSSQASRGWGQHPAAHLPSSAEQADPASQIEKAARLLQAGAITQTEFDQLKSHALSS